MTDRPGVADSAGVPWAGRTLASTPFAGDDGSADAGVTAALARATEPGGRAAVVRALAGTRLLVPVVAVADERAPAVGGDGAPAGPQGDRGADMALVTLTAPDGRRALPVFTSTAAAAAWDARARPVPVEAERAALSAVDEGCALLVVDPGGGAPFLVPRPAVEALAQQRTWTPSPELPEVAEAVTEAARSEPAVVDVRCEPGRRAELAVVLALEPGLDRSGLQQVLERVQRRLASSGVVARAVDALEVRVVAAPPRRAG